MGFSFKITGTAESGVKTESYFDGLDEATRDKAIKHARYQAKFNDTTTLTDPDGREVDYRNGGQ